MPAQWAANEAEDELLTEGSPSVFTPGVAVLGLHRFPTWSPTPFISVELGYSPPHSGVTDKNAWYGTTVCVGLPTMVPCCLNKRIN